MSINPFIKISKKQKKDIETTIRDFCKKYAIIKPRKGSARNRTKLEKYELLSKNKTIAYKIAKLYNIEICPYCNENFTYTLSNSIKRVFRPDFDHFLCKAEHPSKALNVYNLVPSCQICNSRIKGDDPTDRESYYHPYFDNLFDDFEFIIDPQNSNWTKGFSIKIIIKQNIKGYFSFKKYRSRDDYKRAENTINFFFLEERANHHKQEISKILELANNNSISRIKNIQSLIDPANPANIIDMIFPYYQCDIKTTSLGKLKSDITKYVMKIIGLIK